MQRDRRDIGPGIDLTVESTVNITIIIGEEEIIIMVITMTEIIDPIIEITAGLEIEAEMIDMTIGLTTEEIIIDKTMVTMINMILQNKCNSHE